MQSANLIIFFYLKKKWHSAFQGYEIVSQDSLWGQIINTGNVTAYVLWRLMAITHSFS